LEGAIVIETPNFGYGMKEVVGSIPISSTNQAAAESSEENRSSDFHVPAPKVFFMRSEQMPVRPERG